MSVNSYLSSNDTHPYSFTFLQNMHCFFIKPSSFIFITTYVASIVILFPVIIFILYHGVKQWRQNISSSSAAKMSHSDIFTYHMAIIELIGVFGYILILSDSNTNGIDLNMLSVGTLALFINWYGQTFFHILTCLECYLAVVHPITYLKLRNERGIRIRNIIIGCVWLLLLVFMYLVLTNTFVITDYCFFSLSLFIIFFCTISVLCVLIRPGPGDQVGVPEKIDQSKQRAFYTMVAILGVQVLRFIGSLLWKLVFLSIINNGCLMMACVSWTILPSSLVSQQNKSTKIHISKCTWFYSGLNSTIVSQLNGNTLHLLVSHYVQINQRLFAMETNV